MCALHTLQTHASACIRVLVWLDISMSNIHICRHLYIERNSQVQQRMGWIILEWLIGAHHSFWVVWSHRGQMLKDSLRPTVLFLMRIVIWEPFMTGNFDAQLKAIRAITNNISRLLVEQTSQTSGGNFSTSSPSMPTSDPCGSCCICCRAPPTDVTTSEPISRRNDCWRDIQTWRQDKIRYEVEDSRRNRSRRGEGDESKI